MKIEIQILVNKFGQNLISINEILNYFQQLDIKEKPIFLLDISNLIIQMKVVDMDIDSAIFQANLKPSFTPCVMIKKGIKNNTFQEIIKLPQSEFDKILLLFLSLFKIGYQRNIKENTDPYKWWFYDLSNENITQRIKQLTNINILVKKLFDDKGYETGAILTAFLPFATNIYEKNIVEKQLELYAFNKLYPNQGLSIYKNIYEDTASLTIIKNINDLANKEDFISISIY